MNPNASILGLRDPAMHALMGASGANFGNEDDDDDLELYAEDDDWGAEFGDEYELDEDEADIEDTGDEIAAEFGDDVGAAVKASLAKKATYKKASRVVRRPTTSRVAVRKATPHLAVPARAAMERKSGIPVAYIRAMAKLRKQQAITNSRNRILEPNKGSKIKVEKYSFTISQAITLGAAVAFTTLNGQPDTTIRPQRVTMNAPVPMFAFIQEIKVANVSVSVGSGLEDAFDYSAIGVGQQLDMPTLSPANRATVLGQYTGLVPPGYVGGTVTNFSVSFKGPASIVA